VKYRGSGSGSITLKKTTFSNVVGIELKKVEESAGALPGTGLADLPAIPPATQYQECRVAAFVRWFIYFVDLVA
jgi:hypothetical protein